jgi:hypothetical protein
MFVVCCGFDMCNNGPFDTSLGAEAGLGSAISAPKQLERRSLEKRQAKSPFFIIRCSYREIGAFVGALLAKCTLFGATQVAVDVCFHYFIQPLANTQQHVRLPILLPLE